MANVLSTEFFERGPCQRGGPGGFLRVRRAGTCGGSALWCAMLSGLRSMPLQPCKLHARLCAVPLPCPIARHAAAHAFPGAARAPWRRAPQQAAFQGVALSANTHGRVSGSCLPCPLAGGAAVPRACCGAAHACPGSSKASKERVSVGVRVRSARAERADFA